MTPIPHRRPGRRPLAALAVGALAASGACALIPQVTAQAAGTSVAPAATTAWQAEGLGRGAVAVPGGNGVLVSWRLLATDRQDVAFNVYRNGTKLTSSPLTSVTTYLDRGQSNASGYTVRAVVGGVEQAAASALAFGSGGYLDVPITPPGSIYSANDASVGDLDGDGDLDLVLKWDPSDAKDNSQSGTTSNVVVDGVTLEGKRLWRIDLGRNIRAGAHYTQFQVFDYDFDGKAEVVMKTGDGTTDGTGRVIGDGSKDYRTSAGYVLSGPEYLTVFDGTTGAAKATTSYVPPRGDVGSWGDTYGNRVDRFLAATAYLDGVHPSIIMCRGYYTRTVIAAWDWTGGQLKQRWTFDSNASGNSSYAGQGNHNLSVADVDGDGRDEIVYGSMAVDDNGARLWNTGNGHGDALHVGDLDPSRPGLEVFKVDEDSSKPTSWLADARTGQVLWSTPAKNDNGRGVADDVWAGSPGAEAWSSSVAEVRSASGSVLSIRKPGSANFLSWWDGDPVRELLDGTHIDKYGTSADTRLLTGADVHSNNGTKSTPSLSGDILGDWREEVIWPTTDNRALRIYSTPIATDRRIVTLLHDRQYREGLAWQNTAYNQPPHPSFLIGDGMGATPWPTVTTVGGDTPTTSPTPTPTTPTPTPTSGTAVFTDTFESGSPDPWLARTAQKLTLSVASGGATTSGRALQVTDTKKANKKTLRIGPRRAVDTSSLVKGQWYAVTASFQLPAGAQPGVFALAPQQQLPGLVSYPARSVGGWVTTTSAFQWTGKGKLSLLVTVSSGCDGDAVPLSYRMDDVTLSAVAGKPSGSVGVDCSATPATGTPLRDANSQRCLSLTSTSPGTVATLDECSSQRPTTLWSWTAGSTAGTSLLRTSGACLQPAASSPVNGTRVVAGSCSGGSGLRWIVNNGTVVHEDSGLCLDVTAKGTAVGTEIELWACNGGANQQWSWVTR